MQRFLGTPALIGLGATAFAAGLAVTLAVTSAAPPTAAAVRFQDASFAPIGEPKPAPYGWLHFCGAQPAECEP
jgi:predicted transglutaminase-like cysteine proteinase